MTQTVTAAPVVSRSQRLAARVAALLPERAGHGWTVEPYQAWWSVKPAARLVQADRALILIAHPWRTDIGWQLPDREPYQPDRRLDHMAPEPIAREVLRLVLPVLDDEAAGRAQDGPRVRGRLELLDEIGHAMRLQGVATYNRVGLLPNTSTLAWGSPSGARYSVTAYGTKPECHVSITGPVRAVERAVGHFLPEAVPGRPVPRVRGRLARRMAAVLARRGDVEQTEQGGLAFGTQPGPYGYVAAALDPISRAHDTTPASVDVHGIGADLLISLAPQLCR
ncbi:hypothetical protein [Streptomyces sp. SP18BB07]|uniref:hypothetical protein n=1 Tax=Streptomyces sp. SP18BB07 TaxID=3002522 RepID=UPI002E7886AC|nr:hypothetical protein [Streptomyces sp. SP18BB07]MEE1764474.1 hypothetical protein [Streptomyces sp. SP18BB07]